MDSLVATYAPLLETVAFSARAHRGQLRKDRETPYASHPFRVCLIVRHVFGCDDPQVLMAALLHDTLEDTRTDYDDLMQLLPPQGKPIADWVAALSKDTRIEEEPREAAYRAVLAESPWPVKLCKLADIFDNLLDSRHLSSAGFERLLHRTNAYLSVLLDPRLTPEEEPSRRAIHERALSLVTRLREEIVAMRALR